MIKHVNLSRVVITILSIITGKRRVADRDTEVLFESDLSFTNRHNAVVRQISQKPSGAAENTPRVAPCHESW